MKNTKHLKRLLLSFGYGLLLISVAIVGIILSKMTSDVLHPTQVEMFCSWILLWSMPLFERFFPQPPEYAEWLNVEAALSALVFALFTYTIAFYLFLSWRDKRKNFIE